MTTRMFQKNASPLFALMLFAPLIGSKSYAADLTIISTVIPIPPSIDTTTNGDVMITAAGALTGAADGIIIDSPDAIVTILPNNASTIAPDAINTLDTFNTGILALGLGSNATITVGQDSNITAEGRAVYFFLNSGSTLTNSGTLTGGQSSVLSLLSTSSITNTSTGSIICNTIFPALNFSSDVGSKLENSGTISSDLAPAILLEGGGSTASIINTQTGLITSTNSDVISVVDNSELLIFQNSGTITATSPNKAINFSGTNKNITLSNAEPGVINGDVLVSTNASAGIVLDMTGGTINGVVSLLPGPVARIFNIQGGMITGGIDLSPSTQADVINLTAGNPGNILGNTGSGQIVNILGLVTSTSTITDIDNIIVNSDGTLRVAAPINNVLNLTVQSDGGLLNTSTISGVNLNINANGAYIQDPQGATLFSGLLQNDGNLLIGLRSYPSPNVIVGNYTQSATGTLEIPIKDDNVYGQIQVTGTANLAGTLNLSLTGTGFNQTGDLYRIITTGSPVIGDLFINGPTSQTLNFARVVDPNNYTLEVTRVSLFYPLADSPITQGPAAVLDSFLPNPTSPEIRSLIGALDSIANVNEGLVMLVPSFDGALIEWSQLSQRAVFDGLGRYIDEHKWITGLIPGYVAGDVGMGRLSGLNYSRGSWVQAWGARARQAPKDIAQGYDLESIGFTAGYDQYCSPRFVLGGALSYSTGSVTSKNISRTDESAKSFQLTGYSTYDYKGPGYLDTMIAVAFNQYMSQRNVVIGPFSTSAFSDYSGWNYGINLESGYRFSYSKYRMIPVVKARYTRLQLDNYTETGIGGINLSVANEPVEEGITSIGVKFNSTNGYLQASYVPEFRFNIVYDWIADASFTTSNFIIGGPAFTTEGFNPQRCTYNFGTSLTVLSQQSLVCVLNFDLDLRKDFVTYLGSVKLRYEW